MLVTEPPDGNSKSGHKFGVLPFLPTTAIP